MPSFADRIEAIWRPEIDRHHIPSIGRPEAELLASLAAAARARRVLEFGTAIGYSAAYMAEGAGPRATVTGVELNPSRAALARRLWHTAGLGDRIEVREGDALRLAPTLGGGYDVVFVDLLWELGRREAGEEIAQRVTAATNPGAVVVADNCVAGLPAAEGFLERIAGGPFQTCALLPLGDGMLLAVKETV